MKCDLDRKNMTLESLFERTRAAGMKLTIQRRELLQILFAQTEPVSADDIFKKLKKNSGVDLVTVYRCLKKFEECNLISRLEFGDGINRFELNSESGHHHHHVICKSCQSVVPLHICDLEKHIKMVEAMGYTQVTHRLEFFGLCSKCS